MSLLQLYRCVSDAAIPRRLWRGTTPVVRRRRRLVLLGALIAGAFGLELRTSWLQARVFAKAASRLGYTVEVGQSPVIRFPAGGPYNDRLGYSHHHRLLERLLADGFQIRAQARWWPLSVRLFDAGLFPIYPTKTQAGLLVTDRRGRILYSKQYPERVYERFEDIPSAIVTTLLFIENRELLEGSERHNPAVEYDRLVRAMLDLGLRVVNPRHPVSGGSTLATQLEKLRHSEHGRTGSVGEKGRQIVSASLRAYLQGENTVDARRRIVRDYLNALPLGAIAGHGEVIGFGDGLWAWYDSDFDAVNRALWHATPGDGEDDQPEQATAYRQALSLLLAARRPTTYLAGDRTALEARTDRYLQVLAAEGIITPALRDLALAVRLQPRERVVPPPRSFADHKSVDRVRAELLSRLGLDRAHDLDRLDLTVRTTLDGQVNANVSWVLQQLGDREYARSAGLMAGRLLSAGDPGRVVYGVTLYERTPAGNVLRVQSDSYDQPLGINDGTRLELGSTAKLRTLVTYLDSVEALHRRYAKVPAASLREVEVHPRDRLTRWAIDYLAGRDDRNLETMLEAAMVRQYSASPAESFFTGGGVHHFRNFDTRDNHRVMTVREAFERSVNLVFIRLMRDLVSYHTYESSELAGVLGGPAHPARQRYLQRFADVEGQTYLRRFYARHENCSTEERIARLAHGGSRTLARLSAIFRAVRPDAGVQELGAFLAAHVSAGSISDARVRSLYEQSDPARWTLQDLGYLARVHPLELWLVGHLDRNPGASLQGVLDAGAGARQEAYRWLFRTTNRRAQQRAIQTLVEADAFERIHGTWRRHGYPFRSLVPSYATAIGSSGDSPAALSELLGIVLDGGVRRPAIRIETMHFASGTPYDTLLSHQSVDGERVLAPAVASLLRRELVGVVERGTGRRLAAGLDLDASPRLEIGGKTGTGDNRFEVAGPRGRSSRVVSRTAAFAFTIGDRFYGTILAFVPGHEAAGYDFTSALPVQVLRHLLPVLEPVLAEGVTGGSDPLDSGGSVPPAE